MGSGGEARAQLAIRRQPAIHSLRSRLAGGSGQASENESMNKIVAPIVTLLACALRCPGLGPFEKISVHGKSLKGNQKAIVSIGCDERSEPHQSRAPLRERCGVPAAYRILRDLQGSLGRAHWVALPPAGGSNNCGVAFSTDFALPWPVSNGRYARRPARAQPLLRVLPCLTRSAPVFRAEDRACRRA